MEEIVTALRRRCKKARLILRGDSGLCHDEIMAWCERQAGVYYCLGLAKNSVLLERADQAMMDARARHCLTGAVRTRSSANLNIRPKREPGAGSGE